MTFTGMFFLLIIAAIFASLAQYIIGYKDAGWILSTVLGFLGAFIGLFVADKFHLPPIIRFHIGSEPFPIAWIIFGALFFVLIVSLVQRAVAKRAV
jgi:uncharacterized membrane protein YeaQ/YmgE (transglycosylase-associated protein family)